MSENIFSILLKRATYASSGTLISRISASLAGIIIARAVGPKMFGVYAAVLALIEFSMAFTHIGLVTGLKREGSRSPELIPFYLGNVFIAQLLLTLTSLAIAFAALPLVNTNPLAKAVFYPLGLVLLSTVGAEAFLAVLQIRGEQRMASFFIGGRGLAFLGGIIALAFLNCGVVALAWYHAICYLFGSLLILFSVVLRVPLKFRFSSLGTQVKGAIPFGLSGALFAAYGTLPILYLSHLGPEESVGNFAVALRFVTICTLVGTIANNDAFLPALFGLFRTDRERFARVCASMQRFYVPAGIFVSSALYASSEALVIVLQGEEYRPSIGVLRLLGWSVALTFFRIAADSAITAGDRMGNKILFQILGTGGVVLASLCLIPAYREVGAGYTMLLGEGLLLVLMGAYAYGKKLYPFSGLMSGAAPAIFTLFSAILFTQLMPSRYFLVPSLFLATSALVWYLFWSLRPDRQEWGRIDA